MLTNNPWLEKPAETLPALEGDVRADVVVVGAGYTGLSAALALKERGVDVVVLERDYVGAGASGSNSGHLSTTVSAPAQRLVRSLGEEGARTVFRFSDQAVEFTEARMRSLGIDADYVANGNISASLHPDQDDEVEDEALQRRALGARVAFMPSHEMRERGIPDVFRCGLMHESGGILDPGKYVHGLRDAALAASIRIFEDTPVERIEDGSSVRVVSARGTVTADALVLATNAFTPALDRVGRSLLVLRVCCVETEPLSQEQRSAMGWAGQEGISTRHLIPETYRWTGRGSIAAGTRMVHYARNNELSTRGDETSFAVIERSLRARFPALESVNIAARWGGWVASTTDSLPVLGTGGTHLNVFHAVGYSGHGVAQATLLGDILAARVCGESHDLAGPFTRTIRQWPAEPIRWIGGTVALSAAKRLDRRTDRKIAGLAG